MVAPGEHGARGQPARGRAAGERRAARGDGQPGRAACAAGPRDRAAPDTPHHRPGRLGRHGARAVGHPAGIPDRTTPSSRHRRDDAGPRRPGGRGSRPHGRSPAHLRPRRGPGGRHPAGDRERSAPAGGRRPRPGPPGASTRRTHPHLGPAPGPHPRDPPARGPRGWPGRPHAALSRRPRHRDRARCRWRWHTGAASSGRTGGRTPHPGQPGRRLSLRRRHGHRRLAADRPAGELPASHQPRDERLVDRARRRGRSAAGAPHRGHRG